MSAVWNVRLSASGLGPEWAGNSAGVEATSFSCSLRNSILGNSSQLIVFCSKSLLEGHGHTSGELGRGELAGEEGANPNPVTCTEMERDRTHVNIHWLMSPVFLGRGPDNAATDMINEPLDRTWPRGTVAGEAGARGTSLFLCQTPRAVLG